MAAPHDPAPLFLPTPFRLDQQRQINPVPQELTGLFAPEGGLQYKHAVWSYLEPFLSKDKPDMTGLLQDLKDIWNENGLLPVDDLTEQLLERRHTSLPKAARNILHKQIEDRYRDPEQLTQYDRRQHMPLSVGLGHLYAVLTGRPVSLIMVDDSNLGGLTEHMEKLIAARDGRAPQKAEEGSEAYELADRVVRTMAGVARHALDEGLRDSRRMTSASCWRTGGDERLFLVTGLPPDRLAAIVKTRMEPAVETFMAAAGQQHHEHLKHRDEPVFSGTSSGFAVLRLDRNTKPADLKSAEDLLGRNKTSAGVLRHGRRYLVPFNGLAGLDEADQMARTAAASHKRFNALSKKNGTLYPHQTHHLDREQAETDPATGSVTWYSDRHLAPYDLSQAEATRLLGNLEKVLTGPRYGKYQQERSRTERVERSSARQEILFASPAELETLRFNHNAQKSSLSLSDTQTGLCHRLLGSFSPTDPATGGWMRETMPELFGRFAHDTQRLRTYITENQGLVRARPEQVQSFAVAASMQNLAGVNKLLGNKNADLILRHFANEIVLGGFASKGIASSSVELGHEGGGYIAALPRPLYLRKGVVTPVTGKQMTAATATMEQRMEKWRKQKIVDFLKKHGGDIPDGLDPNLAFGDIPDPKRASRPGISIATAVLKLETQDERGQKITGGQMRNKLRDLRNAAVENLRRSTSTQRRAAPAP